MELLLQKGSDYLDNTWGIQKKVAKGMLFFNMPVLIIGLLVMEQKMPFVLGLVFGCIISLLNFRLLSLTLQKAVYMPPHKAQAYATARYLLRYMITGVVIYVSIQADHIHVLGTIIGLISIKLVIFKLKLFNNKQYFKNILKREGGK